MSPAGAVLFDLDGTLTDSRLGILRSARYACERLSEAEGHVFALPEDSELGWMIGPPLRDSFAKLVGAEHVETLMSFYLERYTEIGAFENHVYEGIPAALDFLRGAGVELFVATSKNEADARRILEHFDLSRRFDAIHGARADGARADKTALLAYVLERHGLGAGRDRIAMVGDRKFDAIGARNVGIAAIGALWGYGGREELQAAGADPIVPAPAGLPPAVTALFTLKR
jgi:phosphoglycolate phosphatase